MTEAAASCYASEMERAKNDSALQKYPEVPREVVKTPWRDSLNKSLTTYIKSYKMRSPIEWFETFIPMVKWLRIYDFKTNIMCDIIAGLTVTAVIIPQSISFAKLAGLPIEFGLYSSFIPIYAYSVFGSSRQLAVGTSAVSSLTFNSVMMGLNPNSKEAELLLPYVSL
jgi:hypothetical protein